jgi:hypothetical protein
MATKAVCVLKSATVNGTVKFIQEVNKVAFFRQFTWMKKKPKYLF